MLPPSDARHNGERPSKTSCSIKKILRPSASDSTVNDKATMPSGLRRFLGFAQALDRVDKNSSRTLEPWLRSVWNRAARRRSGRMCWSCRGEMCGHHY